MLVTLARGRGYDPFAPGRHEFRKQQIIHGLASLRRGHTAGTLMPLRPVEWPPI
jgi:hypothetical protein